jgi:uncharacterized protein YjbJ (UPF0337 family)
MELAMNEDILKGRWMQLKGKIRERWGKLTDDDVAQIQGSGELLLGKIREHYGRTREQAEDELSHWLEDQQSSQMAEPRRG